MGLKAEDDGQADKRTGWVIMTTFINLASSSLPLSATLLHLDISDSLSSAALNETSRSAA